MKEYEQKICNIIENMKAEIRYQCDRIQEQAYKQGYATGYDRGNEDGYKDEQESLVNAYAIGEGEYTLEDVKKAEHSRGLTDAWNAAKKANEIDADVYDKLFPMALTEGFYESYTAKEVIEKLAEYEDKQKQDDEIKVGDEIKLHDAIEVVTSVMCTGLQTIDASGNTSTWYYDTYPLDKWKKTGKHYPQIAEVLAELRGAENDI